MTEFILYHFIDNDWKPTAVKVTGVVKEVFYLSGIRVRNLEDGSSIEDTSNFIWLSSKEQIPQILSLINDPSLRENQDSENSEEEINFYDDDKPERPLITFNEYVRDHDHW